MKKGLALIIVIVILGIITIINIIQPNIQYVVLATSTSKCGTNGSAISSHVDNGSVLLRYENIGTRHKELYSCSKCGTTWSKAVAHKYSLSNGTTCVCGAKLISVTGITLTVNNKNINYGEVTTFGISATIMPSNATNRSVSWSSSNTSVATVSGGTVTIKGAGTAIIKATSNNGKSANCTVIVSKCGSGGIIDSHNSKGEIVEIYEDNGDGKTHNKIIRCKICNKDWFEAKGVAHTYNANGVCVCGMKTVVSVTGVILSTSNKNVNYGDEPFNLTAFVTPSSATNKAISWTSSNENVATVSGGTVTIKGGGVATIKATSSNGISGSCVVTVKVCVAGNIISSHKNSGDISCKYKYVDEGYHEEVWSCNKCGTKWDGEIQIHGKEFLYDNICICGTPMYKPDSIVLKEHTKNITYGENLGFALIPTISPSNPLNQGVTWSSSNENVATVTKYGAVLIEGIGTTVIKVASIVDSNISDSCVVNVIGCSGKTGIISSHIENEYITYQYSNADKNSHKEFWTCSKCLNSGILLREHEYTQLNETKCICGATMDVNNGIIIVTGVKINDNTGNRTVSYGDVYEIKLTATVEPPNATDKTVIWSSSNTGVATVKDGIVTIKGAGKADITVTSRDNMYKKDTCSITVAKCGNDYQSSSHKEKKYITHRYEQNSLETHIKISQCSMCGTSWEGISRHNYTLYDKTICICGQQKPVEEKDEDVYLFKSMETVIIKSAKILNVEEDNIIETETPSEVLSTIQKLAMPLLKIVMIL